MNTTGILFLLLTFSCALPHCAGLCDIHASDSTIQLKEWTGSINSPGIQSGIYPNTQDCTWEITVSPGSKVKVTFHLFDLEDGTFLSNTGQKDCLDFVKVNDSSGDIFYNCGAVSTHLDLISAGDQVTIYFHSDESGASRGFRASYTGVCESDITTSLIVSTANYPSLPPAGIRCSWRIGHPGALVNILKAVQTEQISGSRTKNSLPDCGKSPLMIVGNNTKGGIHELCVSDPIQAYTENLTLVYDTTIPNTDVWVGEIFIDLAKDLSCSNFCVHSSGCQPVNDKKVGRLKYNCVCENGFEGLTCKDVVNNCRNKPCISENPNCLEERDTEPGSHIFWFNTSSKQLDTKPCPVGALGKATRNCLLDLQTKNGGLWTRPDLSSCVSPNILQILQDATMFVKNVSKINPDHLLNISSRLLEATDPVMSSTTDWHPLFPGDLITVVDVLAILSEASVVGDLEIGDDFIQRYMQTVDNIVDPKTTNIWKNALANVVEQKVSKIIESSQQLITNNRRRFTGLRHKMILRAGEIPETDVENEAILEIRARNFDIKVIQRPLKGSMSGEFNYFGATSSVLFPGIIMDEYDLAVADKLVDIYLARFSSVSPLLSITETRYHIDFQNDTNVVNSDVVSVEFLGVKKTLFKNLKQPVVLVFSLKDPDMKTYREEKCVFMNMTTDLFKHRWSTSGCVLKTSNQTHVECHCDHLTNFAVLMDVFDNQNNLDPGHKTMLTYISYIGGSLSILACIITITVFQYFKLCSDRISIHKNLSLSIIFVQIMFICMGKTGREYGTPLIGCRIVATLLHYCLTAMFCWMLVEGTHLYMVLVRVFERGSHFKKYLAVGWGIPLIIVGISIGAFHDKYGAGSLCWLDRDLLLICFAPTVGIVVFINTAILIVVIRVMLKSNNSKHKVRVQERNNVRIGLKAAMVLLPLLGLTWIFGFLAVNSAETQVLSYIFTYLFTITNSFQGVVFFIFHCLLNVDVRQAYDRRYHMKKRMSSIETTLSRLRKPSEPDLCNGQKDFSKNNNSPLSVLNNLSPNDHRLSYTSMDNVYIDNAKNMDKSFNFLQLWTK